MRHIGSADVRLKHLDQVRRLVGAPHDREDYSPFGRHLCLVLDNALVGHIVEAPDAAGLNGFLSTLPCPVVAIAPDHDNALPEIACDVVVSSEAELTPIVANIGNAPLAATSLVQVLRATAAMPIVDALNLESFAYATLQAGPEFRDWLIGHQSDLSRYVNEEGPPILIQRAGDHLELTLNRPASRNTLSVALRDSLCEALQLVQADPTVRSVSIIGKGRCFSIGGDVREFGTAPDPATGHAIRSIRMPARLLADCAERIEFRLHGACIGAGAELPAFGRRITAAKTAFFQLPEIKFGLIPGAGGCVSIPRRIGRQRAAYLALSARRISADRALSWGLIDAISD